MTAAKAGGAHRIVTVTPNCAVDRTVSVADFAVGVTAKAKVLHRAGAGKGVNVSRTLSALGIASTATGIVGRDCADMFADDLARSGVAARFVVVDTPTRISTTILDAGAGTETHLREIGARIDAQAAATLRDVTAGLARRARYVAICGSLPPGLRRRDLVELVCAARDAGARVVVDAEGDLLKGLRRSRVFMIAPNVAELAQLAGRRLTSRKSIVAAIARELRFFDHLLVSWGARGAFFGGARGIHHARVDADVPVRNTVGCGDALLAAFLAARLRKIDEADALADAVAVAAAAARTDTAGTLDRHAIKQYRARIVRWGQSLNSE